MGKQLCEFPQRYWALELKHKLFDKNGLKHTGWLCPATWCAMRYIINPRYRGEVGSTNSQRSTISIRADNFLSMEYERAMSNHAYGAGSVLAIETTLPIPVGYEIFVPHGSN